MLFYLALGIKKVSWLIICSIAFLLWANLSTLNIVHIRIEAWLNPWLDPSGKSYQILQSLIAIANGGIFGKGIGLGHHLFIPISFSDFIFSAIVEENGIIGGISIILIYALFTYRGIKITQKNQHAFLNIASAGATYLISLQSLMFGWKCSSAPTHRSNIAFSFLWWLLPSHIHDVFYVDLYS
jgi:cell division protein FtsW (lipid II flippase)